MSDITHMTSIRTSPVADWILRILALASLLLVVGQTVTAGLTVFFDQSWLTLHADGGKVGSVVIVGAVLATWIKPRRRGLRRAAGLLALFYALQALWLHVAPFPGLGWLKALHVPNSLLVFLFAWQLWLASAPPPPGAAANGAAA